MRKERSRLSMIVATCSEEKNAGSEDRHLRPEFALANEAIGDSAPITVAWRGKILPKRTEWTPASLSRPQSLSTVNRWLASAACRGAESTTPDAAIPVRIK